MDQKRTVNLSHLLEISMGYHGWSRQTYLFFWRDVL
jgi:hypothetical protein